MEILQEHFLVIAILVNLPNFHILERDFWDIRMPDNDFDVSCIEITFFLTLYSNIKSYIFSFTSSQFSINFLF